MIHLYHGGGASDVELIQKSLSLDEWGKLKPLVSRLLKARGLGRAAELLDTIPFDVFAATNCFGDEFSILYLEAPLEQYVELAEKMENPQERLAFRHIAKALSEVGQFIRFIAVDLDTESGPEPVPSPVLSITSDSVERALADAEQLIHGRGAVSGVDRVHTAFHGYLKAVAAGAAIAFPSDASITQLFKALREQHPKLAKAGPRAGDIGRITQSMAVILDALNPVRNQASIAHANEGLLQDAEAMLVINSVRTLLHYMNARLEQG